MHFSNISDAAILQRYDDNNDLFHHFNVLLYLMSGILPN